MASSPTSSSSLPGRGVQPLVVMEIGVISNSMVAALLEEATRRGWRLLDLHLTDASMGDQTPAGAIVSCVPTDPMAARFRAGGYPVVRLGRFEHPDDASMPVVLPDLREAGRMAADNLAERGFRDLALIGHKGMKVADLIYEGLKERAEALGCACHPYRFEDLPGISTAERYERRASEIGAILQSLPKPLGLVSPHMVVAAHVIDICRRVGLAVPEDVAVLAVPVEGILIRCELAAVPISTVDIDEGDRVRTALRLLDDRIHGRAVPARTYVPPRGIVTRRSTEILAVDHPLVARSIRFLWDHLDENLSVDDVAREMKTPRYKLERLFRKHFKRGINAELRRKRLERFCELLRSSNRPVDQLAPLVGFNTAQYLHTVFCKTFGLTPRQYRLAGRKQDPHD